MTEVYVGGNFITQSAPTNFHTFWNRKVMTDGESIDDYRVVTTQEKSALEQSDAQWVEPSADFVAQCKSAGVVYNLKSGYFELNGLTDITTEQMRTIYEKAQWRGTNICSIAGAGIRTNLFLMDYGDFCDAANSMGGLPLIKTVAQAFDLEVLVVSSENQWFIGFVCSELRHMIQTAPKLREIKGYIDAIRVTSKIVVANTDVPLLTKMHIINLKVDVDASKLPKLSLESISTWVAKAINTSPITITLHPEAYARLTDELTAQAAAKNITFASA